MCSKINDQLPTSFSEKNLAFCHITKTAGSAIEEAGRTAGLEWGKYDSKLEASLLHWHQPLSDLEWHQLNTILNDSAFFCVVRDPIERCISEFFCKWGNMELRLHACNGYHLTKLQFNILLISLTLSKTSFRPLSRVFNTIRWGRIPASAPFHWLEQSRYTHKDEVKIVRHICRFENLTDDLQSVVTHYGIVLNLAIENRSKKIIAAMTFIVRSKVKTTAFRRSDLSLKPFARRVDRDGLSVW